MRPAISVVSDALGVGEYVPAPGDAGAAAGAATTGAAAADAATAGATARETFVCLVHYHELGLKGRNRASFERQLNNNIKAALAKRPELCVLGAAPRVRRISGRELISAASYEQALLIADLIRRIPGVAKVSCACVCVREMAAIGDAACRCLQRAEPFASFKVSARRAHTDFPLNSMQINEQVGACLCEQFPEKKVQMRYPDVTVHVEVIEGNAYLYTQSFKGIGGLPAGSAGAVVSLLSAGIDSPVATWQLIRRGARVHALHFSGAPETTDVSVHLVRRIAELLQPTGGLASLAVVAFGGYQRQIALSVPERLRVVFYRRLMYAVACDYAVRVGAKALVTGESLGQVASQTLDNIRATDAVASLPVLRPLIGSDKQEIVNWAEELGTFAISTRSHDDCCTLF
ncbi:MAG: tRNA 4-thiouridine(8) synthase ThiI, partial [Coriobacteriales bacterium]|nr:tRNA 4-thiouridine(8) synthase ThiI [Coriobacteriales bacterium]